MTGAAELELLAVLLERARGRARIETLTEVAVRDRRLPVTALMFGSEAPEAPLFGVVGGVHGLERIGIGVALAWLGHWLSRLEWDDSAVALLERVRIVVVPVLNPGGLVLGTRANPAGVDLMRNAPVDADAPVPALVGGHRLGPALPWYRGPIGAPMQPEADALCRLIEREARGRPFALTLDCHSGFGMRDRLWFPHACTRTPPAVLPDLLALFERFERDHPQHPYLCEPQSRQYLSHGDLWDHLSGRLADPDPTLLALTLEMGSWRWVRKNPRQLFSRHGLFNPTIDHRERRVMRRHLPLLDFLLRASAAHTRWRPTPDARAATHARALTRWYRAP